jgi:hypothetical protein
VLLPSSQKLAPLEFFLSNLFMIKFKNSLFYQQGFKSGRSTSTLSGKLLSETAHAVDDEVYVIVASIT